MLRRGDEIGLVAQLQEPRVRQWFTVVDGPPFPFASERIDVRLCDVRRDGKIVWSGFREPTPAPLRRGKPLSMAGPLKNARHERFAQELAKGKSKAGAYKAAGFDGDRTAACRLSTSVNVQRRVSELKAKAAERTIVTVADIAQQLDEDREFARELEAASAAVSATMGKAKVLGLLEDKTKVDITTMGQPVGLAAFYGTQPLPNDE